MGDTHRFASNQLYTSTSSDDELFTYVREDLLRQGTWLSFRALLDNFNPDVRVNENRNTQKRGEEDRFLNAVINTSLMKLTWKTLSDHGYVSNNINEFKNEMRQWWFQNYSRSRGRYGSSGFEHIFCGEIKEGGVIGFHKVEILNIFITRTHVRLTLWQSASNGMATGNLSLDFGSEVVLNLNWQSIPFAS